MTATTLWKLLCWLPDLHQGQHQRANTQQICGRGITCSLNSQKLPGVELLQELCVEATRLNGQMIQLTLLVALGQDVLLNGLLADQTVDVDLTCLTNAMTPVLSLRKLTQMVVLSSKTTVDGSCRQQLCTAVHGCKAFHMSNPVL